MRLVLLMLVLLAAACSGSTNDAIDDESGDVPEAFPDVVGVSAVETADGTWIFDVTLSSPYDSPERYADAWRIIAQDGTEFGIRELLHDHANEQPFTRSLAGVVIPIDVAAVIIEGRDSLNGWGGDAMDLKLDGRG